MRHTFTSRRRTTVLAALLAALGCAAVAAGAIPSADGTITGCYTKANAQTAAGLLRVVDAAETCRSNEARLVFNQRGPQGPIGPKGDKGDPCLSSDPACVGPQGDKGDKGDQGVPGPSGASDTLWAAVNADGKIAGGSHVTGTTRPLSRVGRYRVSFDRDVSACAVIATPGATFALPEGGTRPPVIRTSNSFGPGQVLIPDSVDLDIRTPDTNDPEDHPFFVAVHC